MTNLIPDRRPNASEYVFDSTPSPSPTSKQCKRKNNDTGWQCPNTITVAHKTRGFCGEHWDFNLNKSIRCAKTTAKPAKRSSLVRIQIMPTCPDTTPATLCGLHNSPGNSAGQRY